MTEQSKSNELKSTGYELFILLLSLLSILNLILAIDAGFINKDLPRFEVLIIIDSILTVFFLFDFLYRLFSANSKSNYFFKNWGWSDLLACIPFLRIFRVFRIVRAGRLLREFGMKKMLNEVINNRAGSALYITMISIIVVAEVAAIFVLRAESRNPKANITTAGDAVWWVFVTLTTVGYGDFFPTTSWGRTIGLFVMFSGVALIGVLSSFLANFFLSGPKKKAAIDPVEPVDVRASVAKLEAMLEEQVKANEMLREQVGEIKKLLP